MLAKYSIEFTTQLRKHAQVGHYVTDDPVACEEVVAEMLERGYGIRAIRHEGVDMPRPEFDRMIKVAAGMLAARHICASLGSKAEEEKHRFGFSA